MFIANLFVRRRHSFRSAMFGIGFHVLTQRRRYQQVTVYKHVTPPE
jgi:hypothetical protein